ncbi:hypothetical protein TWF718_000425 [Orbilia javanica]|uniref:Uncharacterized protein n=1 Tax=Orbilia javanica TaxID=47235 RepID=A0AAN8N4B6_9PEZI
MISVIGTVALAILSCASSVYGHALIIEAEGNHDTSKRGRGLGFRHEVHKNGRHADWLHPFQLDSVIFKDPLIPCCGRHRVYSEQGCGLTLFEMWRKDMLPYGLGDIGWGDHRVHHLYNTQRGYKLNIAEEVDTLIKESLIPQASAGGWMKMRIHQVNADGAGPFRCKLDQTGLASNFTDWIPLTQNIPGDAHSVNHHTVRSGHLWLQMPLPKDLACTGTYGNYQNICMVRCENQAVNGPFGGCVPFQQVPAPIKETPTSTKPTPTGTNGGEEQEEEQEGEQEGEQEEGMADETDTQPVLQPPKPKPAQQPPKGNPAKPQPSIKTVYKPVKPKPSVKTVYKQVKPQLSIKTVYKPAPRPTGAKKPIGKGQKPTPAPKAPAPKEDVTEDSEDETYF